MNNIYVDELPKCCDECPCCNSDIDYGACCNLGAYGYVDYYPTTRKHPSCPLKPLTDRLAEERKKVVQEIKKEFEPSPNTTIIEGTPTPEAELVNRGFSVCKKRVYKVLDRIERGE